jgi:hypothetical protein
MTRDELLSVLEETQKLLPPVATTINGVPLPSRTPMHTIEAVLATDVADEEGILRRSKRKTGVRVYLAMDGRSKHLYELGIPVVEQDLPWDIEIMQKVPLNAERDNVTPAYLRDVHVAVLNEMHTFLKPEEASLPALQEALEDRDILPEALNTILTHRYGEKRAIHDPSDTEAERRLVAEGYQIIQGGSFSKATWANIKRHEAAHAAGHISPTYRPYSTDPNAPARKLIQESEWTAGMRNMAAYAQECARRVTGHEIAVFYEAGRMTSPWGANYGSRELTFNYARLGKAWFDQGPTRAVNDLLIHELAHEFGGHLTEEFDAAMSRIGATMVEMALIEPSFFAKYRAA